jgi:hypothetical protein
MSCYQFNVPLSEGQLAIGRIVKTKMFGKSLEKEVSQILSSSYDIESYCNITCKVVSKAKDGIIKLSYTFKGYTSIFDWPISGLSKGYGIKLH